MSLLKKSFQERLRFESFYTGGEVLQSADEQHLFTTCGTDVKVVDIATGAVSLTIPGDTEAVTSIAVNASATRMAVSSRSLQVRIFDLKDASLLKTFKALEVPVIAMDIDASEVLLAVGGSEGSLRVYDIEKGYCTHNFRGHTAPLTSLKFHPDNNKWTLFSASNDGQVRSWDLISRSCSAILASHVSAVSSLCISPDGYYLLSGGRDKVANLWNLRTNTLQKTITVLETIESVGFVPAHLFIEPNSTKSKHDLPMFAYTVGDKGVIRIWNVNNGECIAEQTHQAGRIPSYINAFYNRDLTAVGVVGIDETIQFFTLPSFDKVRSFVGSNDEVVDIKYVNDEKQVAVATTSDQVRLYDLSTRDCRLLIGHTDIVICLDVSSDGTVLASGSKDHQARLWHIDPVHQQHHCFGIGIGHMEAIGAIALPRKSTSKFVLTGSEDRTIKSWLWSHDLVQKSLHRLQAQYTVLAHDKDINAIAVAPNDKMFASASQDKTAKLWNTSDGTAIGILRGHKRGVWSVVFSPVDQVVATSSGDKTIKLWSVKDFTCLKTFEGHQNSVLRIHFLAQGLQVLSVGSDGLAKLWTVKTAECTNTFDAHEDKVWALAVKKDESEFVSGGADSLVRVWQDMTQQQEEEQQQQEADRLIKEQELSNLLYKKDYRNAIRFCLNLDQPRRLAKIFSSLLEDANADSTSITGSKDIDEVLTSLSGDDRQKLLGYVKDWNTNAKLSRVAQVVLHIVLSTVPPQKILDHPSSKQLLQALIPYTERHLSRADTLITRSFIVDYILDAMDSLHAKDLNDNDAIQNKRAVHEEEEEEDGDHNVPTKKTKNNPVLVHNKNTL